MRRFYFILSLIALFLVSSCKKNEPVEPIVPSQEGSGEKDGYYVIWEDLFDNGVLNTNIWTIEENSSGGGNNELQYYSQKNVTFETEPVSGRKCLVLTARKENAGGRNCTSGRLNTRGKASFLHGKIEALIKLPVTYKGLWPAFWMMGNSQTRGVRWPMCGEIDILEMGNRNGFTSVDKAGRYMNGALHYGKSHQCFSYSTTYPYNVQDGEFHLFTLLWTEKFIRCYVDLDKYPDAEPYFQCSPLDVNPDDPNAPAYYFHKPFYLIFCLAVGGNFPGIYNVNGITAFNAGNNYECKMYIDYVKVYSND